MFILLNFSLDYFIIICYVLYKIKVFLYKGGFFIMCKREELIKRIEELLVIKVGYDVTIEVSNKMVAILNDYEITERSTEVVVVDNPNEKIIKRFSACMMVDGKSEKTICNMIVKYVSLLSLSISHLLRLDLMKSDITWHVQKNVVFLIEPLRICVLILLRFLPGLLLMVL